VGRTDGLRSVLSDSVGVRFERQRRAQRLGGEGDKTMRSVFAPGGGLSAYKPTRPRRVDLKQIVKPSYYFLKSLDTFQEGDEYKEYDWSSHWTKVDPLWFGYKKRRFLSYRCKVRRLIENGKV